MSGFLEFHMARSHIEMQRKRNRDEALNRYYNIFGGENDKKNKLGGTKSANPAGRAS